MNNSYLSKKIYHVYEKGKELNKRLDEYHENNEVEDSMHLSTVHLNYLLSFITMIDYLDEKVDTLLNKIMIFNRRGKKPIKKEQVYLLLHTKKRLRILRRREKIFLE